MIDNVAAQVPCGGELAPSAAEGFAACTRSGNHASAEVCERKGSYPAKDTTDEAMPHDRHESANKK